MQSRSLTGIDIILFLTIFLFTFLNRVALGEDDALALQTEVDILSQLDHPNVVKLFEIFEDKECMYLVLEIMSGGEVRLFVMLTKFTAV